MFVFCLLGVLQLRSPSALLSFLGQQCWGRPSQLDTHPKVPQGVVSVGIYMALHPGLCTLPAPLSHTGWSKVPINVKSFLQQGLETQPVYPLASVPLTPWGGGQEAGAGWTGRAQGDPTFGIAGRPAPLRAALMCLWSCCGVAFVTPSTTNKNDFKPFQNFKNLLGDGEGPSLRGRQPLVSCPVLNI